MKCFRQKNCSEDALAIAKYYFYTQSEDSRFYLNDPRFKNFNAEFPVTSIMN